MTRLLVIGLASLTTMSAGGGIWVAWECRVLADQLMRLELEGQRLQTRWGQLLLEEAALGALPRVESQAEDVIGMKVPTESDFGVLAP